MEEFRIPKLSRPLSVLGAAIIGIAAIVAAHLRPPDRIPKMEPPAGVLRVMAANIDTMNRQSKQLSTVLASIQAHILVVIERSNENLNGGKLRSAGYEFVIDDPRERGGTHGSAVLLRGMRAAGAEVVKSPWGG